MSVAEIIVITRLLAGVYNVDADLVNCVIKHESDYDVLARNTIHLGLAQFNPDTMLWLDRLAKDDPLWLHRSMEPDATDPIYSIALLSWAVKNGRGDEWSTWTLCGGEE